MQRHKMNHSYGQQGGQQGGHAENGADSHSTRPEDGFLEHDGIMFGQNVGKNAATDAVHDEAAASAENAASVESIIEERCTAELTALRLLLYIARTRRGTAL